MTEAELVRRCQGGSVDAFAELYRSTAARALQTARLIAGDWATAEDCLQEGAIRAWRAIGRFEPGRPFAPWFLKIVVNEALKTRRRSPVYELPDNLVSRPGSAINADPDAQSGDADLHLEQLAARQAVAAALASLDAAHRAPVVLFYFNDLSEKEIATLLGLRLSTVKSRLHTARRRMAEHLRIEGADTFEW